MRSPEAIQYPVGQTKPFYTPEGARVGPAALLDKPEEINKPVQVSSTAKHEAWHAGVGIARNVGINGADIIPKGHALGTTYPDRFDGPTAAAGHASGTGGHGHDFFISRLHGRDPYADSATASAVVKQHEEAITDIAINLDTYKSLSRSDLVSIFTNAESKKEERGNKKTQSYEVPIKTKGGKEEKVRLEVPKEATMLHVPLPKSGDIYNAKRDSFYSESAKDF